MNKNSEIKHGEMTTKYVCSDCGSNLYTEHVISIEGEPMSICKSSTCVLEKDGNFERGVAVNVREA